MKAVVMGSGGWGTALALVLCANGHDVTLWSHNPEKAEALRQSRENPLLKGVRLPDELEMTARLRMENEHLSLAQLASIITPPISKPGLSHRLKKITELAEEILKGNLGNT